MRLLAHLFALRVGELELVLELLSDRLFDVRRDHVDGHRRRRCRRTARRLGAVGHATGRAVVIRCPHQLDERAFAVPGHARVYEGLVRRVQSLQEQQVLQVPGEFLRFLVGSQAVVQLVHRPAVRVQRVGVLPQPEDIA